MKKITDPDYKHWQEMHALPRNENYWIYFSPDNLYSALVNTINQEIIFISDRKSGEPTYTSPNSRKHAQVFYAMKTPPFKVKRVI